MLTWHLAGVSMPRACVGDNLPHQAGWSEDFCPARLSLSQRGYVLANSVTCVLVYIRTVDCYSRFSLKTR